MHRNPPDLRIEDMGSDYERLFKTLPVQIPPTYLCERVVGGIARDVSLRRRERLVLFSLSGVASGLGFLATLPLLVNAATASGFNAYASLAVSDSGIVTSHFSTFALSLLEALPGPETALALFLVSVFLVSLRNIARTLPHASVYFSASA